MRLALLFFHLQPEVVALPDVVLALSRAYLGRRLLLEDDLVARLGDFFDVLVDDAEDVVQVFVLVLVLHVADRQVDPHLGLEVPDVAGQRRLLVLRDPVFNLLVEQQRGFVRPAPGDVPQGVASAAHGDDRLAEPLDVLETAAVSLNAQVEAAELVAAERVCAALVHDGLA